MDRAERRFNPYLVPVCSGKGRVVEREIEFPGLFFDVVPHQEQPDGAHAVICGETEPTVDLFGSLARFDPHFGADVYRFLCAGGPEGPGAQHEQTEEQFTVESESFHRICSVIYSPASGSVM